MVNWSCYFNLIIVVNSFQVVALFSSLILSQSFSLEFRCSSWSCRSVRCYQLVDLESSKSLQSSKVYFHVCCTSVTVKLICRCWLRLRCHGVLGQRLLHHHPCLGAFLLVCIDTVQSSLEFLWQCMEHNNMQRSLQSHTFMWQHNSSLPIDGSS